MVEILASHEGTLIEKYSVLQVSDDGGATWNDFSTIREPDEALIAIRMVQGRGGIYGHRTADYRIRQRGKIICTYSPNQFQVDGVTLDTSDLLQVHRLDDAEDIAAGWVQSRTICTIEDARVAVERCSRFRDEQAIRHWRIVATGGKIRLSQSTPNSLRLSGALWMANPLRSSGPVGFYDRAAARLMESGENWDSQASPILDELNADSDLREFVFAFLALTL
jgi:hypothetical protein